MVIRFFQYYRVQIAIKTVKLTVNIYEFSDSLKTMGETPKRFLKR